MKKGQRPRQHIRRISTNSGRTPTTINRGVKFRDMSSDANRRFNKLFNTKISDNRIKRLRAINEETFLKNPDYKKWSNTIQRLKYNDLQAYNKLRKKAELLKKDLNIPINKGMILVLREEKNF